MKLVTRLLAKGAVAIAVESTLAFTCLLVYLNLVLNLNVEKLVVILKYGLPFLFFMLAVFAASIPVSGRRILGFCLRYEKGETFSDEELTGLQRKLINFPYIVAFFSCFFWVIAIPVAIYPAMQALEWGRMDILLGSLGGIIGGVVNMPLSMYATSVVTGSVMDLTFELSPEVPRAGKVGLSLPLSWKIILSFSIVILGFVCYVGLAGYARIVRFPGEEVIGGLFLNFMLLSGATLGLTAQLAFLATRDITSMLNRLKDTTFQLAAGELEERARVITNDEMGELAEVINIMADNLLNNRVFREQLREELNAYAVELNGAAQNILAIAREQSTNASEQSAAVKEVATTHDQILDNARQVVESARQSDTTAESVVAATREGLNRGSETVNGIESLQQEVSRIAFAMENVTESAGKINEALRVIEEIAERSNLLSLNASLEAAGSGEKGRRFAVVAQQITQLSSRSGDSAKRIKKLMDEIGEVTDSTVEIVNTGQKSSAAGVKLVRGILDELNKINTMATSSSEMAKTIDLNTHQQQSGLEQASSTLKQMVASAENVLNGSRQTETELDRIEKLSRRIQSSVMRLEETSGAQARAEAGELSQPVGTEPAPAAAQA